MKVYLVRHASAGDREKWTGDDALRPLDEEGRRQAKALAAAFKGKRIKKIVSSPYVRCRQTVEPLAKARKLPVEENSALSEGTPWKKTLELITAATEPTVMCSQADVIANLVVNHLIRRGLVDADHARWSKASTWKLTVDDGAVRAAKYVPPPG
jgi:8-oxo-dGTP diphosphatase